MNYLTKRFRSIIVLALSLTMAFSSFGLPMGARDVIHAASETTYVLAGSDFQARDGHTAGANTVKAILDVVDNTYSTMDGFLFGGDYDVNYNDSANGKLALQNAVQSVYGTSMHEVYVQGNHDNDSLVGTTLSSSGNNDDPNGKYGVFVINEQDYMWYNNDLSTIKRTADNLEAYLNAKRNAEFTQPIFVVSHLALHYSMRTREGGNDGMYANHIFDVLNEAGNAGLNIIFLFGHNHSHGWDDYLGGASIFLTKGDKINIAQDSTTIFEPETLAFTYMNYGYVGYYGDSYPSDVDKTLTMSTFAITDDNVTINRFDSTGIHNLKSTGVYNVEYPDSSYYSINESEVYSPYVLTLNKTITPAGEEITPPSGDNENTGTQRTYTRIKNVNELVSDDKYLVFYNGTHFMLPEVVEKSNGSSTRKGFNIESTSICGPDTVTGQYQEKEWVLTQSNGKWLLGDGSSYLKFTQTSNYGITATLESSGDELTIGGSENSFTFGTDSVVLNYNSRGLINGYSSDAATFYIYRLTDEGESGSSVNTSGNNWVTITEPTAASIKYVYELDTDGVDTGVEYLIVANSYPKALSAAASSNNAVDVEISGNYAYANSDTYGWTFTRYSNGVYYIRLNNSTYLALSDNALGSSNSTGSSRRWTVTNNNNGSYDVVRNNYNLRWSNSNGVFQVSSSNEGPVRLYKYVDTETTDAQPGLYGMISGDLTYNVNVGTSKADAIAIVKEGIEVKYHNGDANNAQTYGDNDEGMSWILEDSYDGSTPGEYKVTIAYNGVTLGVAKVVVPTLTIKGYSVEPAYGLVYKGSSQLTQTGSYIYVQLEDNHYYTVPVTVNMLTKSDGQHVSTGEQNTYEGLTLTYNGKVLTNNYTLKVILKDGNHYPEYPHEGAVKVNKTATGIDFQSSGLAKIELSASGVPVKKGADVIIMLDTSSSMNTNKVSVNGKEMTRLEVMKTALKNLIVKFQQPGDDGEPLDIKVAVADFNRYYINSDSPYYLNENDHLIGNSIRTNASGTNKVYTGTDISASAFKSASQILTSDFDSITYASGTNYDYGLDVIYQLGEAITTENSKNGEDRDLFVIFMSDGAPYQYNYFSSQSDGNGATYWNNWLQGTLEDSMFAANANKSYYNEEGKHWMAEAIKGNPANFYPVIRKNDPRDTDNDNWIEVQGLGATVYSIGFCLGVDKDITVESMVAVLQNIATSSKGTYYRQDTYEGLNEVFTAIGEDITYAASEARFIDTMGQAYDLKLGSHSYLPKGIDDESQSKTVNTSIEVKMYDIYTKADVGKTINGVSVTESMIGMRKGNFTTNEIVVFSADGDSAYSTVVDLDNDAINGATVVLDEDGNFTYDEIGNIVCTLSDTDDNIFTNDVIHAKYFWYNAGTKSVMIDRDGDGINDYNLAPETFYWNIDTVKTQEVALSYYVYLSGSMEGERSAGAYATNESAILYYTNYLGKEDCQKVTISPVMAWESANVSYAFYLVNDEGKVVVNQSTGQTGTFANKVAVTSPIVYDEVLLNDIENVEALQVATVSEGVLPEGYELYDIDASYTVNIRSNSTGEWQIVNGADKVQSTYVTNFGGSSQYSNESVVTDVNNDYTHTVVWFAVIWRPRTIDDVVVVDYGLPVNINVLGNDMFGDYGKLNALGASIPASISKALYLNGSEFSVDGVPTTELTTLHGTAKINNKNIQYKLNDMSIDSKDTLAYEVYYQGTTNPGYYYGEVTVIPATTIYYEDDFVSFSKEGDTPNDSKYTVKGWIAAPDSSDIDGLQDEDRPGQYSLPEFDANNVYGYDKAYKECSTYSMGSAAMTTLKENEYATASFTFNGTGFDVISLSSNATGTIAVTITDENGNKVKNLLVDTYYGYSLNGYNEILHTYQNGQWGSKINQQAVSKGVDESMPTDDNIEDGTTYKTYVPNWVISENSPNSLYQVPVIKVSGLTYGKYNVTITATYSPYFDHTSEEGYTLYLDAIRIYDPANNGDVDGDDTIKNAYLKDNEAYPQYFEIRNEIIDANTFNAAGQNDVNGVVFIDSSDTTSDVSEYKNYGPNNELYLTNGQAISFKLNLDAYGDTVADVQIGLKSATGEEVKYKIYNPNINTDSSKVQETEVKTSTDMYYSIKTLIDNPIVIKNISDSVLSLTNIKVTLKEAPTTPAKDVNLFINNRRMLTFALRSLRVQEPSILTPQKFEVSTDNVTTVGENTQIKVITSSEVDYIYANELTVNEYTTNEDGTRTFIVSLPTTHVGEKEVSIIACTKDGVNSETVVTTVKVNEPIDVEIKDVVNDGKVDATITTKPNVDHITVNGNKHNTSYENENGDKVFDVEVNVDDGKIETETFDENGNVLDSTIVEIEDAPSIFEVILNWLITLFQKIISTFTTLFNDLAGKGRY